MSTVVKINIDFTALLYVIEKTPCVFYWLCPQHNSMLIPLYTTLHTTSTCHKVNVVSPETWRQVCRQILVPLLKSVVLGDVVKVISPNDNRPLHLHGGYYSGQDTTSDAYISREWTLLINVGTLSGLEWRIM